MINRISYVKPSITEVEIARATEAATLGWGEKSNFYIKEFEDNFSKVVESKNCIATSSCTGALHLGLAALGIGPGDEVILAESNWIATLAPLNYLGAKPVFVDILEDTWCIDTSQIRAKITNKTRAIIATHLYGNFCNIEELLAISKEFNLYLIEDAAEAIGSRYKEKHAGTFGDFGVFSFHGSKTITTGEGGMLVTNNNELAEIVRRLNNHGRDPRESRQFWPSSIGFKYRMTNVQAAIGSAQLSRFNELVERKVQILQYYREKLAPYKEIFINAPQRDCTSGSWMPNVMFSSNSRVTREELTTAFKNANIDARVFFWPLSELGLYEKSTNSIARSVASRSINLPSYHDMTLDDQDRVTEVLIRVHNEIQK